MMLDGNRNADRTLADMSILNINLKNEAEAASSVSTLLSKNSVSTGMSSNVDRIAFAYLQNGDIEKARSLYKYGIDNLPSYSNRLWGLSRLAICNIKLGKEAEALTAIEQLFAGYSDHAYFSTIVNNRIGNCFREEGTFNGAYDLYSQIAQTSTNPKAKMVAQTQLAILSIGSDDFTAAEAAINKMIADYPNDSDKAQEINKIAEAYHAILDDQKALELYQHVADNYSGTDEGLKALQGVGIAKIGLNNDAGAAAAVNKMISDYGDNAKVAKAVFVVGEEYYNVADVMREQAMPSVAKGEYLKAIAVWGKNRTSLSDPEHIQYALYYSAMAYRFSGESILAAEYFQTVVDDWPDFELAWRAQASIAEIYYGLFKKDMMGREDALPKIRLASDEVLRKWPTCPASESMRLLNRLISK